MSIRATQDIWIAFPRDRSGEEGWVTRDDFDFVVAASVNDKVDPAETRIHRIPRNEARDRLNRAYAFHSGR